MVKHLRTRPFRGGTRETQPAEENTKENQDSGLQPVKDEGGKGRGHICIVP